MEENMSFFDLVDKNVLGDIDKKKETAEKKSANVKAEDKKAAKVQNTKLAAKSATKKKESDNEKIEKEMQKFTLIKVKCFGQELFTIENDDIKDAKLKEIGNRLITEFGLEEFSEGFEWHLIPSSDKTTGILVATYKARCKG